TSTDWWFLVLRMLRNFNKISGMPKMLCIFVHFPAFEVKSRQSLPPVKEWMENSDIITPCIVMHAVKRVIYSKLYIILQ
ncbi:MAG: hypothetical protein V1740_07705, partial [Candidatus Woesearchaeota archaeon]